MKGNNTPKTTENTGKLTFSQENVNFAPHSNKGVTRLESPGVEPQKTDVKADVKTIDIDSYNPLENGYKIDWLSFSFPSKILEAVLTDVVIGAFGYDLTRFDVINGRNFYNTGLSLGGYVNIYYNDVSKAVYGFSSDTANIVFTGQGMTDVVNRVGDTFDVLRAVFNIPDVSIARVDIAFDNFYPDSEVPSLELISSKLEAREYCSAKRSHNIIKQSDTEGNQLGHSVYLGKHTKTSEGNYFLRVYDKHAQYVNQKMAMLPSVAEATGYWQRWEFVFTKKKAHNIVNSLLNEERYQNDVNKIFKEMLNTVVRFVQPTFKDGELLPRKDWEKCDWWTAFLTSDKPYKFKNKDVDANVERMLIWVSNAVAPTLKTLSVVFDNYGYDFFEILQNFPFRELGKKHKRVINDEKLNQANVNELVSLFANGDFIINKEGEE